MRIFGHAGLIRGRLRVRLVLRRTIAGGLGVRFAHILALFRVSVVAPPVRTQAREVVDMREGVDPTTVSEGQRARACCSVANSPAPVWVTDGTGAIGAGADPVCVDGGAGTVRIDGAGAVAAPPPVPAVLRFALHWVRNCGQVSPFVVPAALAAFHWSRHRFMTLCALAAPALAKTIVTQINAADAKRVNENRTALLRLSAEELMLASTTLALSRLLARRRHDP